MADEVTAPVVEGVLDETNPTEKEPTSQEAAPSQETTPSQVETKDAQPQVAEPQRNRPSNYYRERERIRRLEETIRTQSEKMEELANFIKTKPTPEGSDKFDKDIFFNDPEKILDSREKRLLKEFDLLKGEISQLKNEKVNADKLTESREAAEMLFPKSSPDADESLDDRVQNQERQELLEKVLKANPSLDRLMRIDPKGAAELVLMKLNAPRVGSPKVINKSLMGSTVRGNPSGGGKSKVSVEDKMSELKKLKAEVESNPSLRYDEEHTKRRTSLISEIERLAEVKE